MEIVQLVYHSRPAADLAGSARLAAFRAIHSTAVAENQRNGIGGFLILTKTHFVQLLEGERIAVMATYDRIRTDRRHESPTLLDMTPCRTRSFSGWAMGAIHDPIVIREAMLECGIDGDVDVTRLGARQIASVLGRLAERSKPMAA